MRIALVGKGGSGKTTISAGLAKYISKNSEVLLIDADVNAHLHECLQLTPKKTLGDEIKNISSYVRGDRSDLKDIPLIGSTPPAKGSNFIIPNSKDKFILENASIKENINLLTIGSYDKEDIGVNCYHSKLMAAELIMHHLLDKENDNIIMDATAGVDLLGTSLCIAFDYILFVIEPTKKGIDVFKQFTTQIDVPVKVIVNKVKNEDDIAFIEKNNINPLCYIPISDSLHKFEQGMLEEFNLFVDENKDKFEKILNSVNNSKKDLQNYYQRLIEFYKKSSQSWYNDYYKTDLPKNTDLSLDFIKCVYNQN